MGRRDIPKEAQWTDANGWIHPSKPEIGPTDYDWRWRLAQTPMEDGEYCLQWYEDATRVWTFVDYMSLDDVYLRVYVP